VLRGQGASEINRGQTVYDSQRHRYYFLSETRTKPTKLFLRSVTSGSTNFTEQLLSSNYDPTAEQFFPTFNWDAGLHGLLFVTRWDKKAGTLSFVDNSKKLIANNIITLYSVYWDMASDGGDDTYGFIVLRGKFSGRGSQPADCFATYWYPTTPTPLSIYPVPWAKDFPKAVFHDYFNDWYTVMGPLVDLATRRMFLQLFDATSIGEKPLTNRYEVPEEYETVLDLGSVHPIGVRQNGGYYLWAKQQRSGYGYILVFSERNGTFISSVNFNPEPKHAQLNSI